MKTLEDLALDKTVEGLADIIEETAKKGVEGLESQANREKWGSTAPKIRPSSILGALIPILQRKHSEMVKAENG